ncbi:hypothetical protein [Bradyrhizobium sp. BWA-3-5]|uniref:hypothetical protein n=1 Tax=Bradyrhizobium sp. BWA-3-5 TaxID=3080013 RepID=UPI00293E6D32|nr:hypothetical protein [Bradyrhizobium sp. BWA-3-5]WOH65032.1 hypothetical protein RX331_31470 [Bradyrhizobium sp. BWA-3-5]
MTSEMAAFIVAVGGTSLICFLLMNRGQNRKARRESVSDGTYSSIGGSDSSSTESWSLFSWGGSDSSSSQDSTSSSDTSGDSGGGGGGDGGGGGGD